MVFEGPPISQFVQERSHYMIGVYNNYFWDMNNVAAGRWQPKRQRLMVGRDIAPVHEAPKKEKMHGIVLADAASAFEQAKKAMSSAASMSRQAFDPAGGSEAGQLIGSSESCSVYLSFAGGQGKITVSSQDAPSREFALTGSSDLRIRFDANGEAELLSGGEAKQGGVLTAVGENEILVRLSSANVAAGKDTTVINLNQSAGGRFSGGHNVRYLGLYNGASIEGGSGSTELAGYFNNCDISVLGGKGVFSGVFTGLNGSLIRTGIFDDVFSGYFQAAAIEDKGGDNTFSGTFLTGSSIKAGDGNDTFDGLFFDSVISAGSGNNIFGVKAALENGSVTPSFVRTVIEAGDGKDTLLGAAYESDINLGEGSDEVNGLLLDSLLKTGEGGDNIRLLYALNSLIEAGSGNDNVYLYTGDSNRVDLGVDDDKMTSGLNRSGGDSHRHGTTRAFTNSAFLTEDQARRGLDPRFGHHFGDVRSTAIYADVGEDEVTVYDGQNAHQVESGDHQASEDKTGAAAAPLAAPDDEAAPQASLVDAKAAVSLDTVKSLTKVLQKMLAQGRVGPHGSLTAQLSKALSELESYKEELLRGQDKNERFINADLGGSLSRPGGNSVTIYGGDGQSVAFDRQARNSLGAAQKIQGRLARHCLAAYAKSKSLNS